jgi:hypothetical protein
LLCSAKEKKISQPAISNSKLFHTPNHFFCGLAKRKEKLYRLQKRLRKLFFANNNNNNNSAKVEQRRKKFQESL